MIGGSLTATAAIATVLVTMLINHGEMKATREGQITDRYTAAINNLGNSSADVRLGGIYALQRIMNDSPRDQASIVDALSAYIRTHSRPAGRQSAGYSGRPEADVQAAFEVLARRDPSRDGSAEVDLREAHLPHIAVRSARRSGTIEEDLTGVDPARLSVSNLSGADLRNANFPGSNLCRAYMVGVILAHAAMTDADLRSDWLDQADLSHVNLEHARLGNASLVDASLAQASLRNADLRIGDLRGVNLSGADLTNADLRGAYLRTASNRTVKGRAAGWTSHLKTQVTATQLLTAKLDSRTVLPPEIADDPRIKAKIAASEPGSSPDSSCDGVD
ncbi:pentapeptide repeat-containing protein [Streptomyces populi]